MSRSVVLVDAVRTPFGKAGGMYAGTRADDLMVRAIRGLLDRNPNVDHSAIDDVAIAAATQTGDQGMNIGRSATLLAGLPNTVPGYSIDRWCAGALTAVTTIAGAIAFGSNDIAIAGGVEHMGNHPMGELMDPNPRYLAEKLVEQDALAMGATAERLHDRFPTITKERADRYALNSQLKTTKAYEAGLIQRDLIPTAARSAELGWTIATVDEAPRPTTTMEGLASLKTPFRPAGRVTAGNSSGLNDGATAALLASEDKAKELGLSIKARLVTYAFAGVEPEVMGFGPVPSTIKALAQAGLSIEDIGLIEINEAFAVQVLAFLEHFGIADDDARVNPFGGAIAVGHPLASSGVRLMLNLARSFEAHPEVRYGLTTMCIGLGMGGSVIWENPH
ncbi:MAG: thiolase family protein, partial [Actinobacteria bacterium]|nr:thiolase family protein [Actinomycetota bacterium]